MSAKNLRKNLRPVRHFGYWFVATTLIAVSLQASTITPGAPTADGTVDITFTFPDGTPGNVSVKVPKMTNGHPTTDAEKTTLIGKALSNTHDKSGNGIPGFGYQGNTQILSKLKLTVTGDTTAEVMKVADLGLSLPGSPAYATLGFTGPISATGADGSASVFTVSFGVDGSIFSSASLTYSQLTSPTDDGLATQLYDELLTGLSANLQSDLHLDLSTDSITLDFAPGSGDYFAQMSNTSAGTSQFMSINGVTATPEPTTFLTLGAGLLLIGTLRRKAGK
jgi:hypothetical protein